MKTLPRSYDATSAIVSSKTLGRIISYMAIVFILLSTFTLSCWFFDWKIVDGLTHGSASMKVNTSIVFLLTGINLLIRKKKSQKRITLNNVFSIFILLIGCLTILEYLNVLTTLSIDNLLTQNNRSTSIPGRMSLATAICSFLLGIGFLKIEKVKINKIKGIALSLATIIATISLIGFIVNLPFQNKPVTIETMSFSTAMLFCLATIMISLQQHQSPFYQLLIDKRIGSSLFLRLLPVILIFPILIIFVIDSASQNEFITPRFALITFTGISIPISLIYLAFIIQKLNKKDKEKSILDKELKARLKELNQLKSAIDATSIIARTDKNGIIKSVNDKFCEISKYERNELIGKTHQILNSNHHSKDFFQQFWKTIQRGEIWEGEIKNKTKNGETYWVHTYIIPFTNEDGEIIEYLAIRNDITKRQLDKLKTIQSERKLKQLNLTKDKLFSVIGHDLRSPFNSIIGFTNLIIEENSEESTSRKYAEIILNSSKKSLVLLDNLLVWSKSQTGEISFMPEDSNILPIIIENIDFYAPSALEKHITIQLQSKEDCIVFTDLNFTNTVLRNLLSNAIKFTEPEGRIDISYRKNKTHLEVTIADTGIGMSEEKAKNLFKKTNLNSELQNNIRTGLGLILCKDFTTKNGGDIWVKSSPNSGSAFTFTIPLKQNASN